MKGQQMKTCIFDRFCGSKNTRELIKGQKIAYLHIWQILWISLLYIAQWVLHLAAWRSCQIYNHKILEQLEFPHAHADVQAKNCNTLASNKKGPGFPMHMQM